MLKRRFDRLFSSGTGIQVLALFVVSLVFAVKFILCGYDLSDDADSMRHALHLPSTAYVMPL